MGPSRFRDRVDAGRRLADEVADRLPDLLTSRPLVLGLPRGGVPVAAAVADRLGGELDVLTVRKIGAPFHEELAIGAVASGGLVVRNDEVLAHLRITGRELDERTAVARRQLADQESRFRLDRARPVVTGRDVVVVDDGLATGATMRAAVGAVRTADPARVVVAVPVGAPESCVELEALADAVICLLRPPDFSAVGQWYVDFSATTDGDVIELLTAAR
jgi:putative phosphoribosyl transferase